MEERTGKEQAQSTRPRFDPDQRARIRDTLIAYMELSAIGVPTLQKEIAIANDVVLDRIPLSTLQRFLANSHRTNDSFIGFCETLASTLPVADPVGDLARALSGMFETTLAAGASKAALPLAETLTGYYTGTSERTAGRLVILKKELTNDQPYCRLRLTKSATGGVYRLHEQIIDWKGEGGKDKTEPVSRPSEGVGLVCGERFFALLRNQLTDAPRTYWMAPLKGWAFDGEIIEIPAALEASASRLRRIGSIRFAQEEAAPVHAGS